MSVTNLTASVWLGRLFGCHSFHSSQAVRTSFDTQPCHPRNFFGCCSQATEYHAKLLRSNVEEKSSSMRTACKATAKKVRSECEEMGQKCEEHAKRGR